MNIRFWGPIVVMIIAANMIPKNVWAQVPEEWVCDEEAWGNSDCDCGCEVLDTDCPDASAASCDEDWCMMGWYPGAEYNSVCYEAGDDPNVDSAWACSTLWYMDEWCDCGCGYPDPDCQDGYADSCDVDQCAGGEFIGYWDNENCYAPGEDPNLPDGWICNSNQYNELQGNCDCGCGAEDPNCSDETVASCDRSHCGVNEMVSPTNNALCVFVIVDSDIVDTSVVDTDSFDTEGIDTNVVDTNPMDTDTMDTNTVDTNHVDTSTVDTNTVDTNVVDTSTVDTNTVDTNTVDTNHVDTSTVDTNTIDTNGVDTDLSDTDHMDTTTVDTDRVSTNDTDANDTDTDTFDILITGRHLQPLDTDSNDAQGESLLSSGLGCTVSSPRPSDSLLRLLFSYFSR